MRARLYHLRLPQALFLPYIYLFYLFILFHSSFLLSSSTIRFRLQQRTQKVLRPRNVVRPFCTTPDRWTRTADSGSCTATALIRRQPATFARRGWVKTDTRTKIMTVFHVFFSKDEKIWAQKF